MLVAWLFALNKSLELLLQTVDEWSNHEKASQMRGFFISDNCQRILGRDKLRLFVD